MSRAAKAIKLALMYVLDLWASSVWGVRKSGDVLLVRLDLIGDLVLWLDAAKEYRGLYPGRKIVLCANESTVELAQALPDWDEVWGINVNEFSSRLGYRYRMLRRIRKRGFEIAVQPTFSRVFLHGDAVIRASRATHRIGSVGDQSNIHPWLKAVSDRWYTRLIPARPDQMMELDRNAEFMSGLTGRRMRASLPRLPKQVALAPELAVDVPYFVVFPGASRSGRRWPPEAFAALVERVAQKYRLMPVLCGSKAEVALCQSIIDRASVPAINRAGETSLLELAEMIRRAKLLISNETSAIHLAAAVGTRAICILGGGHYGRFMPYPESIEGVKPVPISFRMPCYGCSWHCTQLSEPGLPVPCIANVPIGRVWQAVELELAQVDLNRN